MFNYGKRLKELRNKRKLSANALAQKIGLDPTMIYKIESGSAKPSLKTLEKICDFFEITLNDFFDSEPTVTSGLHRLGGYVDEDIPNEIREEIERYAEYLIEKYKKGEYNPPKGK